MDVSVIVPIYKVEKYLLECINSIIHQTFTQIQIILVDDGSPDGCGKICDEFAKSDPRIIVIHKANGGLSDARNAGMKVAVGKYILFVDSDDYLEENAVFKLFEYSKKHDLDILMFNAISFEDNPETPISDDLENKYISKNTYPDKCTGAEFFTELVDNRDYRSPVQYFFFNHSFLQASHLVFHRGILHEDEEFTFLAMLYADSVKHLPRVLYHHRLRDDSIMGVRFRKANTDSMYRIITTLIDDYSIFLEDANTSNAYIKGIGRLAKCFMDFRDCSEDRNCRDTKRQFRRIKQYFVEHHYYNSPEIEGSFTEYKKKHSIQNQIKRFVFSHKSTKKFYFSVKRVIKR